MYIDLIIYDIEVCSMEIARTTYVVLIIFVGVDIYWLDHTWLKQT